MMPLRLTTFYSGEQLPALPGQNVWHSNELFRLYEATKGYTPFLIVAYVDERPVAKLLCAVRDRSRWLPFAWARRCIVYGTGECLDEQLDWETVFGELLVRMTQEAERHASVIEYRNLDNALFAYKQFRLHHYFPVNWLRVRNSLHNLAQPMERFSPSRRKQVRRGLASGAVCVEAVSQAEVERFARLLKRYYPVRIRRHLPTEDFFSELGRRPELRRRVKVLLVKYKQRIIGGSVCLLSGRDVYLLFSAGWRKLYPKQYPGVLAVWGSLEYACQNGYDHLEFIDVGLPFQKHGYRRFILQFGGMQRSTRRWFRLQCPFINKIMERIYV